MRLTEEALKQINNKRTRTRLALALDCTERWISELVEANKSNGPLTTWSALTVIREDTKLSIEEILEESPADIEA